MKKALLIIVSTVVLITVAAIGIGIYITNTPEYALKEVIADVNDSGIEGLYLHLTSEARETIDAAFSVAENGALTSIIGLISQSEYIGVLKSEIQGIQWDIDDVLKSKENASVILSFSYEDKLVGTIELSMTREEDEWRIDGLGFPKFNEIDW